MLSAGLWWSTPGSLLCSQMCWFCAFQENCSCGGGWKEMEGKAPPGELYWHTPEIWSSLRGVGFLDSDHMSYVGCNVSGFQLNLGDAVGQMLRWTSPHHCRCENVWDIVHHQVSFHSKWTGKCHEVVGLLGEAVCSQPDCQELIHTYVPRLCACVYLGDRKNKKWSCWNKQMEFLKQVQPS